MNPKTVREFGFILTGFFLVFPFIGMAVRVFITHKEFHYWWGWFVLSILALGINLFVSQFMAFIYHVAMFAAYGISWVVMRLMLGILFYLVLSPLSITMRLLGKDILEQKINRNAQTYWNKRTPREGVERYEHLF